MGIFLAAAIAALVSWIGNRFLARLWKTEAIIFLTPLLEEIVKTALATILGQSIILVHGAFGVIEALYDLLVSRRNGPPAALASLVGHLFYGVITALGVKQWGLAAGVLLAYAGHSIWNAFVIKAVSNKITR